MWDKAQKCFYVGFLLAVCTIMVGGITMILYGFDLLLTMGMFAGFASAVALYKAENWATMELHKEIFKPVKNTVHIPPPFWLYSRTTNQHQ